MFQFSCRFAFFINFSSFKPVTENNENFDAASSTRANFDNFELYRFKVGAFLRHCSVYVDRYRMSSAVET